MRKTLCLWLLALSTYASAQDPMWLEMAPDKFYHNLHAVFSDWDFNPKFTDADFDTTPLVGATEDMNGKRRQFLEDLILKTSTTNKKK